MMQYDYYSGLSEDIVIDDTGTRLATFDLLHLNDPESMQFEVSILHNPLHLGPVHWGR